MLIRTGFYFLILLSISSCENINIKEICECFLSSYNGVECRFPENLEDINLIYDMYSDSANNLRSVQFMFVNNSNINEIPINLFEVFPNLKSVNLDYVNLKSLQYRNFQNSDQLLHLSIIGNNLKELTAEIFANAKNLFSLNLQKNQIEYLQAGCFNGIESLQSLKLNGNKIKSLPVNIFSKLKHLQILDLSNNKLEGINKILFKDNIKLRLLDLSYNNIAYIHTSTFIHMKLDMLDVSFNNFRKLSLYNCKKLHASQSGLVEIIFKGNAEMNELIANDNELEQINLRASSIEKLVLSNNKLKSVILPKNMSIKSLDMSQNPTINNWSFLKNVVVTKSLNINSNKLKEIPAMFVEISNDELEKIDLSNNQLKTFDFELLKGFSNLQEIDITDNNLANIGIDNLKEKYLFDLDIIKLNGNPWNCTELRNMLKYFKLNLIHLQSSKDPIEDTNFYEMYISGIGCFFNSTEKFNFTVGQTDESAPTSLYMEYKELLTKFETEIQDKINDRDLSFSSLRNDLENLKNKLESLEISVNENL